MTAPFIAVDNEKSTPDVFWLVRLSLRRGMGLTYGSGLGNSHRSTFMGSIGVRCAGWHLILWFHLDKAFADDHLHPEFRTDGKDKKLNDLLRRGHPWERLTDVGRRITERVLNIRRWGFKAVRTLSARPDYFRVEVKRERDWEYVLPRVVAIIREETRDRSATVMVHTQDQNIEQWHVPLLQRLFG
jgi:hypothetical protein